MPRIKDRFPTAGRKLSPVEKAAVAVLNAKYPNVPAIARPRGGSCLEQKFCLLRRSASTTS